MKAVQMHWAAAYIGLPYQRGAAGPNAFDCWGWVRFAFQLLEQVELPVVAIGDDSLDNVTAIRRAAAAIRYEPVGDRAPADRDIVLMDGLEGRHVGLIAAVDGRLLLLHCIDPAGVCAQPLDDVRMLGFAGFVFWRRA